MKTHGPGVADWRAKLGVRNLGLGLSDDLRARLGAAALWLLVGLAAVGGLVGLLRPAPAPEVVRDSTAAQTLSSGWAAAGFAERFVSAYLAAGPTSEADLSLFLGYSPDLPAIEDPAAAPGVVHTTSVAAVGEDYWAVTVAAGDPGDERFWRVGVMVDAGQLVVTGLPTPVGAPRAGEPPELAIAPGALPSAEDPALQTVEGFAAAYMCGQGELDRYLAPGASVRHITRPVCSTVRLDRWGSEALDENRQRIVTEVVLDAGPTAQRVTLWLELSRRDGRWEIADLLPAPTRAADSHSDQEVKQ